MKNEDAYWMANNPYAPNPKPLGNRTTKYKRTLRLVEPGGGGGGGGVGLGFSHLI